jgi:hypothetical protein
MALWAGSAFNTNESAKIVNQLADKKSIPMVVKTNALLYAITGKDDKSNDAKFGARKLKKISGKNYEVGLMGKIAAPAGIADGSAEVATATVTHVADIFGAAEFAISHYGMTHPIPHSEWDRIRGDEAKTLSFIDDVMDYLVYGYENVLGNAIHANVAPSRTAMGGWEYAVAEDNTYGTIDRTDSTNADFRGNVEAAFGDTTLAKLNAQINSVRGNMGKIDLGVTGETLFGKIQQLVQAYSQVTYSSDTARFGSPHVNYAGVDFLLDQRASSGTIGMFDTRWWDLIRKDVPFSSTGFVHDFTKVASHICQTELWIQLVCRKPNAQIKLQSAT